jgi:hypothetical protein
MTGRANFRDRLPLWVLCHERNRSGARGETPWAYSAKCEELSLSKSRSLWPAERTSMIGVATSLMGDVWTAPGWQEESSLYSVGRCGHVFGLFAPLAIMPSADQVPVFVPWRLFGRRPVEPAGRLVALPVSKNQHRLADSCTAAINAWLRTTMTLAAKLRNVIIAARWP